jgi:hypothetical protein
VLRVNTPVIALGIAVFLASCAGETPVPAPSVSPIEAHTLIEQSLPANVTDRPGWTADMYGAFSSLTVTPTHENICAVVAVIEQESGFHVDPVIPGLGAIARKEIARRADHAHVPLMIVNGLLDLKSSNGRTYGDRIDNAKTEKQLSDVYEDFIGAVPMGTTLFAERNPIRTRGPMQVNIAFAEQFAAATPYPYSVKTSIADEVFTRRGSLYFGVAHLLDYRAPYSEYLYRFADFNAGQYASRNAAFQSAVSIASGITFDADGALLPHEGDVNSPGSTELAVRALAPRLHMSDAIIHDALAQGRTKEFETTALYQRVFAIADQKLGRQVPRAVVPQIKLLGPKIKRSLTTDWYAHRVDGRFKRCLSS